MTAALVLGAVMATLGVTQAHAVIEVPDPELCGYPNVDHLGNADLDGQLGQEHIWRDLDSLLGKVVIQPELNQINCWPYTTSSTNFAMQGTVDLDGAPGAEVIVNNSMPIGGRGYLNIITHRTGQVSIVDFQNSYNIYYREINGQPGQELVGFFLQPNWSSAFVKVYRARTGGGNNYSITAKSSSDTPTVTYANKDGVAGDEVIVQYSGPGGQYGYEICDRTSTSTYYDGTVAPNGCPAPPAPPTPPPSPPPPPPTPTWPTNCGGTSYEIAFEANTTSLWTVGKDSHGAWNLGMMRGTSPSIACLAGGGYQVAFQANNGHLMTIGTAGGRDWGLGMMAGTSPSITGLRNGGYQIAFQANTSQLWTVGTAGNRNWQLGMMPGTSPSIAGLLGGGFQVAFQANTSNLWTVGTTGGKDWRLGMKAGTSPSITGLKNGGYQIAFQANTGVLWWAGTLGTGSWNLDLAPGTSPAINRL